MDNKLPNVNKDKPVWRCVDWSTEKANDRQNGYNIYKVLDGSSGNKL